MTDYTSEIEQEPEEPSAPWERPCLGPGDDDPRSPITGAIEATGGPPGPGDGGDDRFHTLAPAAAGPGDAASRPRRVTQIPKRPPAEE